MKNPPTLADACAATALDKRFSYDRAKGIRAAMKDVVSARKFVLDRDMSAYLAELSVAFWRGGLRKRNHALDNVRQLARLPHPSTWIEIEFSSGYMPRALAVGNLRVKGVNNIEPAKYGWLLRQHPKVETSFICTEFRSATKEEFRDRAFLHPISMAWSSTDDPVAFRQFGPGPDEAIASEWMVGIEGYVSSQAVWSSSFEDEDDAFDLLKAMEPPPGERHDGWEMYVLPRLSIRDVWALLATINDLPIKIEHVEPSKGYVARGSYKKFLKHSIIHLTVPEAHWRRLVLKTSAILRRRAHQVRGHWRKDWRRPLAKLCEHDFDDEMICRRCDGHQIWIPEHARGDSSIGFVIHDYEVHHDGT